MSELDEKKEIKEKLSQFGLLPEKNLVEYVYLLLEWNKNVNLTGAKDIQEFVLKHVLDTWLATQQLKRLSKKIVDVGSGSGVPGLLLSVFSPESSVTLVERRTKRASILSDIVKKMGFQQRVEVIGKDFERAIECHSENSEYWMRGFLPGPKLISYLSSNFKANELGSLYLMKGPNWETEKIESIRVPNISSEWRDRFAESREIFYELPNGAGSRYLVLL